MPLRSLTPRDPHEAHRTATPLELFTDLCFVVAIAQAAYGMHHGALEGHAASALGHFCMAFFAIWWAWLNFAWFTSAYDDDGVVQRVLTLLQVFGSLVLAAGVAGAFEDRFTLVIVGYVIMRLALVAGWFRAANGHPERRRTALRYAYAILAVQVYWVFFLLSAGQIGVWGFLLGVALELAVPLWAEAAGATPWHPHHIAERYGLFFIIVLGESILSATVAIQEALDLDDPDWHLLYVVVGGVLILFSVWWLYFAREAGEVLTGNDVGFVWGFGHGVVFASGALLGAGLALRVDYWTSLSAPEPSGGGGHLLMAAEAALGNASTAALVTVPAAALLASIWFTCVRLHDATTRTTVPFAAAVALCLLSAWLPAPELATGLVCVALLVVELRLTRGVDGGPAAS